MEFLGGLGFARLPLKRFYKYVLKRLIGGFLQHDIDLEQLEVQLYRGIVQLKALELNVEQFNLALLGAGILLHFSSGMIGCIKMDVPWRHLLRDQCKVYISGLHIALAKGPSDHLGSDTPAGAAQSTTPGGAGAESASTWGTAQAGQGHPFPGRPRYSEEGIETLTRLVKHVLSRMEVCFHDASLSLLAPPTPSVLRARVASVVVFSERPDDGGEEARSVRVLGLDVLMAAAEGPVGMSGGAPDRPVGSAAGEMLLLSTRAPEGAAAPAVVHARQRALAGGGDEPHDGPPVEAAGLGLPAGVHLDIDCCLPAIRFALSPASWRRFTEFMAALEGVLDSTPTASSDAETEPGTVSMALAHAPPSSSVRSSAMVQSLVESSLPGHPSRGVFWHDLYHLFEADSPDSASAEPGGEPDDGEDASLAEEVRLLGIPAAAAAEASAGPVVALALRLRVERAGALLVLGEGRRVPRPADVCLAPGPASAIKSDQAQLCIETWELSVERSMGGPAAPAEPPHVTAQAKRVSLHLHRHCRRTSPPRGPGKPQPQRRHPAAPAATEVGSGEASGAHPPAPVPRHVPEEYIIHSMREDPGADAEAMSSPATTSGGAIMLLGDGQWRSTPSPDLAASALFCSAHSGGFFAGPPDAAAASSLSVAGAAGALAASGARSSAGGGGGEGEARGVAEEGRAVARTPTASSCHCSTTESLGMPLSEESAVHSPASSLCSFNDAEGEQSPRRGPPPRGQGAERAASRGAAAEAAQEDGQDSGGGPAIAGSGVCQSGALDGAAEEEEEPGAEEEAGHLEALFFDRSRPLWEALHSRRRPTSQTRCPEAEAGEAADERQRQPSRPSSEPGSNADGEVEGTGATGTCTSRWRDTVPGFRSKCLLRLQPPPPAPPQPASEGAGADTASPAAASSSSRAGRCRGHPELTLPPRAHPVWDALHTAAGGSRVRVTWIGSCVSEPGAGSEPRMPAVRLECQPLVVSACADSMLALMNGTTWLTASPSSPSRLAARARAAAAPAGPPTGGKPEAAAPAIGGSPAAAASAAFSFVAVAPAVRFELALGCRDAQEGAELPIEGPWLVTDLVAPRLFACPERSGAAATSAVEELCEEVFQLGVTDLAVHLVRLARSAEEPPRTLRMLFLDSATSGPRPLPAAAALSGFLHRSAASTPPVRWGEGAEPAGGAAAAGGADGADEAEATASAPSSGGPAGPDAAPQATGGGLSEWTKISVPEGPAGSKGSLVLQDLRQASQRFLRPGQHGALPPPPPQRAEAGRRGGASSLPAMGRGRTPVRGAGEQAGHPGPAQPARCASADAARLSGPSGTSAGGVACKGRIELELSVPGIVRLQVDSTSLLLLQAALLALSGRLADALPAPPPDSPRPRPALASGSGAAAASAASTLLLGGARLDLLEGPESDEEQELSLGGPGGTSGGGGEPDHFVAGEDAPAAGDEALRIWLAPIQCRFVQFCDSSRLVALAQDVCLEGLRPGQEFAEQLIRPWYRPLFHAARERGHSPWAAGLGDPADGGAAPPPPPPSYPWEVRQACTLRSPVPAALLATDDDRWRDGHSLFLQADHRRTAASESAALALQASRVVLHAHPRALQAYRRLLGFLCPPAGAPGEERGEEAFLPPEPAAVAAAPTTYRLALRDCFVDAPSEAYARTWPTTSPLGVHVPTPRPTVRGGDSDKWRVVVHLEGLELTSTPPQVAGGQDIRANMSGCNVFVVDHPAHLCRLDLITAAPRASDFLAGLGFAHVLSVSGLKAGWCTAGDRTPSSTSSGSRCSCGEASPGRGRQAVEVAVSSASTSVCADTLRCILCIGVELAEALPTAPSPAPSPVAVPPGGRVGQEEDDSDEAAEPHSWSAVDSPRVSILQNIDMFAFETPTPPSGAGTREPPHAQATRTLSPSEAAFAPPPRRAAGAAEAPPRVAAAPPASFVSSSSAAAAPRPPTTSLLVDDYIRAQLLHQTPRSPVLARPEASSGADDPAEMEELELPGQAEVSLDAPEGAEGAAGGEAGAVAVCLFDPEAIPEGELRELYLQDHTARLQVERLFEGDGSDEGEEDGALVSGRGPPAAPSAPASSSTAPPHTVLHQDGSAAVWFVDPGELQVVADHFAQGSADPQEVHHRTSVAPRLPAAKLAMSVSCDSVQLSLCGGLDFGDEAELAARAAAGGPEGTATALPGRRRRHAAHVSLQLQGVSAELTAFEAAGAGRPAAGPSSSLRRRLALSARDFSIIDRVPGSVFSHLLAYFEDEKRRPRPSHVDMLRLRVDEVLPRPLLSTQGGPMLAGGEGGLAADSLEYRVDVRLLPLRLTIDQDAVAFLLGFVQLCTIPEYVEEPQEPSTPPGLADGAADEEEERPRGSGAAATAAAAARSSAAHGEAPSQGATPEEERPTRPAAAAAMFFQHFCVSALLLSVDYRAKRLDVEALRRGELWELVNLLPLLEGLQIAFRSVTVSGVTGIDQVVAQVVSAWSADLNRTQILRSLTGVTPIRSFANIGGGLAEMVLEPLKQYRTGGGSHQVSRTLLRGLVAFLRHVTVESIDLTERILVGVGSGLEYVEACLGDPQAAPGAAGAAGRHASPRGAALSGASAAAAVGEEGVAEAEAWTSVERGAADFLQPGGAAEGLEQACTSLTRGMRHAGQAVVVRPLLEFQRGASREQVLRSVVTGIPMCVLRPAIGATAAATTALRGVRNSVDPSRRREVVSKYKGPE